MSKPIGPKLSFIIGARNDGYMGNFNYRFETTLNYLADNLKALGRLTDVEVVVTDWGSKMPLYRVISLNRFARQIVHFILVPPDIAHNLQGNSEFPIVLAQNVAIRRSRAEFIAQTDSEILFTPDFLAALFELIDGKRNIDASVDKTLIVAKRRHVPWNYISRNPKIQELDWFIRQFKYFLPVDIIPEFGFAATGMMMMHRRLWQECGGYDERLIHLGWMEIDLGLRITQKYPWFDLLKWGVTVFHLEHYRPKSRGISTRKLNPMVRNNLFFPNNDQWGLNGYPLEVFTYPSDASDKELIQCGEQKSIQLNSVLLIAIVQVILERLKIKIGRHLVYYRFLGIKAITIVLQKLQILK